MARVINKETVNPGRKILPDWVHPEASYWYDEWMLIRDAIAGEREIKLEKTLYLPKLEGQDYSEYDSYLDRATFYPFTGRTLNALVGTVFYRAPVLSGVSDKLKDRLSTITKDAQPHTVLMKAAAQEVLSMGRVGIYVDLPSEPSTDPKPFLEMYEAENILDWDTTIIADPSHAMHGRSVLSKLVLREIDPVMVETEPGVFARRHLIRYRELSLEVRVQPPSVVPKYTYVVRYFASARGDADYTKDEFVETVPTRRGQPLDMIPFFLMGSVWSSPSVEKPTLLDIARLNLSHYRSYAHLEHGRFFTGMPVYYVQLAQGGKGSDYTIGPSVVWEVQTGEKPGILEFNGQGLKFLQDALDQKEAQASALGGRMIGIRTGSTSESDNAVAVKDRNEQVILLNTVDSLDEGFSRALTLWAWWSNEDKADIKAEHNRDFLLNLAGAREMRAVAGMYADGLIPVEALHDYLLKAEVVPAWMDLAEFEEQLKKASSFPGQPDAQARSEGYKDKGQMIMEALKEWELEIEEQLAGIADATARETARSNKMGERQAAIDSKVAAKQAEQNAKMKAQAAAKPASGPAREPKGASALRQKAAQK